MGRLLNSFGRVNTSVNNGGYMAFSKKTAGNYTFTIPETRMYSFELVGAGAGGSAIYRQLKSDHNVYARWALGGGSAGFSKFGPFKLDKGTIISITVGAGGTALNRTLNYDAAVGTYGAQDGQASSIVVGQDTYSCDGAQAGYLRVREGNLTDTYRLGLGGTGNTIDGNNGQGVINAVSEVAKGGASVYEESGGGGDAKQSSTGVYALNGDDGYVGIRVE